MTLKNKFLVSFVFSLILISDLDKYIDNSNSRCGRIFSPENLMSKNKVDQLRPYRNGRKEYLIVPKHDHSHEEAHVKKHRGKYDSFDLSKVNFNV